MDEKPIVSYAQDGSNGEQFISELQGRLPFKNVEFRNPLRTESHTLPLLEIDIRKYSSEMFPKFAPGAVQYNIIFLHIFVVSVEDLDSYRNTTRKLIQEWMNVVANKKNQEWMIVYLPEKTKTSRLFNMGASASVYEKLKVDFNLRKDRFFHVGLNNPEPKNVEAWHELVTRLRELVLAAITSQIIQYEDDARRLEQQRLIPGWNYCQFFILKEALSSTFQLIQLFEEALVHYDELEASFFQTLTEQGAPWFKKFGATEDGDDNPNIFDLTNKPYRDRIIQNSISIYDFRMYLFSRQCFLLRLLQRPIEICLRAKLFISSFSKTLHENEASLSPFFRESWIYSLSLNVIHNCDELVAICNFSNPSLLVNEGLRGELFLFARYQLDKLGICRKLLSHSFHYDSPPAEGDMDSFDITTPDEKKINTTNEELAVVLKSKTEFDTAYEELTRKCIQSFEKCHRNASVSYLKADMAFLYFIRQNYSKAAEIFAEICFRYAEYGWNNIETVLIERYAICQRQLKKNTNLMQCYLHLVRFPEFLELESHPFYLKQLKQCCEDSIAEFKSVNSALFTFQSLSISDSMREHILKAKISIINHLPTGFHFDRIFFELSAGEGKDMILQSDNLTLEPGINHIYLSCAKSKISGEFSPTSFVMKKGKLIFEFDIPLKFQKMFVIRVEETETSLKFLTEVVFDKDNHILIRIDTNSIGLESSRLEITSLTPIKIELPNENLPIFVNGKPERVAIKDSVIYLPTVKPNSFLHLNLPFSNLESLSVEHKVKLTVVDITESGRKFLYSTINTLFLGSVLKIEPTISYTPSNTFLKYQISNFDVHQARILSYEISPENIVSFASQNEPIIFFNQPHYVVAYVPADINEEIEVTLKIRYRRCSAEIKHFLQEKMNQFLKKNNVPYAYYILKKPLTKYLMESINPLDLQHYGKLIFPSIPEQLLDRLLSHVDDQEISAIQDAVSQFNSSILSTVAEHDISLTCNSMKCEFLQLKKIVVPCKVLLKARWIVEDKPWINVGDIVKCKLQFQAAQWKDIGHLEIKMIIDYKRNEFALGGKTCINLRFTEETKLMELTLCLSPLNPGLLQLPSITLDSSLTPKDGVFIQGPAEISRIGVLPREESCTRYLKD